MSNKEEIKFALEFPQGHILCMEPDASNRGNYPKDAIGGVYFLPPGGRDAFMLWGERKELFGKNAICIRADENVPAAYTIVYEFGESGSLSDARLVTGKETFRGKLADAALVAELNQSLAQGDIQLHSPQDTRRPMISRAARLADGRTLLLVIGKEDEIYVGTPGNYEKLDAKLGLIGGGDRYYKLESGGSIALPAPGGRTPATFKGEEIAYLNVRGNEDPAKFGLTLSPSLKPLHPFSPELSARDDVAKIIEAVKAAGSVAEVQDALRPSESLDEQGRDVFIRRLRAEFSASAAPKAQGSFAVVEIEPLDRTDLKQGFRILYNNPRP